MSRQSVSFGDRVAERREQWDRELPDLDTSPMAVLGRARWIVHAVGAPIEKVFAGHGLDRGEFDVLSTLLRSGPPYRLRPTELYRSLMISSGGLTDRLSRLQRAGLVRREPSADDARSMLVQLTPRGRRKTEQAFRDDMALEMQLLAGLNDGERERLGELLGKLALSLEQTHRT
ncbi:MarR family winged helix-turn-helix transcriptional regulator [Qipengyuania qiaonensis]|uniref:MarR family transcriptional regulator n=1 Tax=Qipengyuania qiaonensis TaxID=2867240 RepID=A0ABS7JAJ3_9SPHN|nr:MarR family transcriptional regulator [Qipengyuania qiaonensis]MBX7482007.1 MarR family transcriptional regulator [Qipengyuania qiaonensis]